MESLLQRVAAALAPALQVDLTRWVSLHEGIPLGLGVAMAALGLLACAFGHHPLVIRLVLAPLAALAAWSLAPHLAPALRAPPALVGYAFGALLAAAALAWPPAILFAAVGLCGGLLGGALAGGAWYWPGFAGGFAAAGLVGLASARSLSILVSAAAGAVALVLGGLSVLSHTRLGALAAASPALDAAAAAALAVLSAAYQFSHGKTDEERDRERRERLNLRRMARDQRHREGRLRAYGRKAAGS